MKPGDSAYFMLRLTRKGPLVPARIFLDDAEPDEPSNKLDRGNLSVYPRAVISGQEVDPDILQRDRLMSPTDWRPAYALTHWKYATPISQQEYSFRLARGQWAAVHKPDDPVAQPREPVDPRQMPLPVFENQES